SFYGVELSDGEALIWSRIKPGIPEEVMEETLKGQRQVVEAMDRLGYSPRDESAIFNTVLDVDVRGGAKEVQLDVLQRKLQDMVATGNFEGLSEIAESRDDILQAFTLKGNRAAALPAIKKAFREELSSYGLSQAEVNSRVNAMVESLKAILK
ncbi:MAG: hypothetical protein K8F91_16755, partial [Candidatus Obscuribacterales bacterium]|nr:hypothetical protein [Candidatus Obscuribacterales bacterium]